MSELGDVLAGEIRGAAFRRLFRTGSPVRVEELAADLGHPVEEIAQRVDELRRRGQIRLDEEGWVAGSAGLSVGPDRHRIEIGGRTFLDLVRLRRRRHLRRPPGGWRSTLHQSRQRRRHRGPLQRRTTAAVARGALSPG